MLGMLKSIDIKIIMILNVKKNIQMYKYESNKLRLHVYLIPQPD